MKVPENIAEAFKETSAAETANFVNILCPACKSLLLAAVAAMQANDPSAFPSSFCPKCEAASNALRASVLRAEDNQA